MKLFIFALLTFFLPNALLAATFSELSAQRLDGSNVQYYLTLPATTARVPLVLVVQGSSCSSIYPSASVAGNFADQHGVARLDLEKYALDKNTTTCPKLYLDNNTIDQRIHDYLRVLHAIRSGSAWWNRELWIVGGSEGGVLAPILATYLPETTKVVIMAGGTGWNMREEMLFLLERQLKSSGTSSSQTAQELKKMSDTFDEAIANPTSSKTYAGDTNTYKWWNSILDIRPLNFMIALDIPILMVHGDADVAAPVESARVTVDFFKQKSKTNLKYIEYPGLDHHWNDAAGKSQAQVVLSDIFAWLFH